MRFLLAFILFLLATNTFAIDSSNYELHIPSTFQIEEYKEDLQNWRLSLLKGLGYDQENVAEAIFLQTGIELVSNGQKLTGSVYQNKDNPSQFYILPSKVIIDFSTQQVGTMGVSGISRHPTLSGRMVIVLAPSKNINLLGVVIDGFKAEAPIPEFSDRSVTFEWFIW